LVETLQSLKGSQEQHLGKRKATEESVPAANNKLKAGSRQAEEKVEEGMEEHGTAKAKAKRSRVAQPESDDSDDLDSAVGSLVQGVLENLQDKSRARKLRKAMASAMSQIGA